MRIHHHIRHIAKRALHATRIVVSQKQFLLFVLFVMALPFASLPLIRTITNNPSQFRKTPLTNRFTAVQKNTGITATLSANKQAITMGVSRKQVTASFAMALSGARATQDTTGVSYQAQNGMSVRYQTIPEGIKEDIILTKHPGRSVILSSISVNHAEPLLTPDGQIVFVNTDGEYQFHIRQPYAVDASGSVTRNIRYRLADYADVYQTIKKDINQHVSVDRQLFGPIKKPNIPNPASTYMLVLDMDSSWLNDPSRTYPITIDPTVVHDTSSEFATGQLNRIKDTGSGASPVLETDYEELPADEHTVGLWHMNEASGNILDSSGNSRTGTPTGTTVVTGKLGNARSFTGADDISLGSQTMVDNLTDVTVEAWVYPTAQTAATHFRVFSENAVLYVGQYAGQISFYMGNGTSWLVAESSGGTLPLNQWSHIGWVKNDTTYYIYLNGILIKSGTTAPATLGTTANVNYFSTSDGTTQPWTGSIDEVRISNIARSAEEIKLSASRRPSATYTSDVIDLTSGTVRLAAWNSFTWSESGVTTGDGETLSNSTSLISQWNFNETSGTTAANNAGSCSTSCNGTLTGFSATGSQDAAAGSGWTAANKRWGAGSIMFNGTTDTVAVGSESTFDFERTSAFSLSAWIKTSAASTQQIISKIDNVANYTGYELLMVSNGTLRLQLINTWASNVIAVDTTTTVNDGSWHYVVATYDGSSSASGVKFYIDGKLSSMTTLYDTLSATMLNNISVYVGSRNNTAFYFNGVIDTPTVFSRALTASEILSNYTAANIEFQTRVGDDTTPDDGSWEAWRPTTAETAIASMDSDASNWSWDNTATYMPQSKTDESTIKAEGSGSMKVTTGILQTDANTAGLWHLDETGGSGAYMHDTSVNANHGTPTGTTLVNGITGKARSFNGTSDYIRVTVGAGTPLDIDSNPVTMEAWIKLNSLANQMVVARGDYGTNGYGLRINSATGTLNLGSHGGGNFNGSTVLVTGRWYHVAGVINGASSALYIDGNLDQTGTVSVAASTLDLYIGADYDTTTQAYFFDGTIDEVRVSSVARTAEEIAESYRSGRDHYLSKTISSTDLSGKTSLPFSIAADRPGTYLETIVGESAFTNYQPDANTIGFWHLNEQSGSGAYIKDSSNNTNDGTPTGTTYIRGKIGAAQDFSTADDINIGNVSVVDSLANLTIDAWLYPTTQTAATHFNAYTENLVLYVGQYGTQVSFYMGNGASWTISETAGGTLPINTWSHVSWVKSGTSYYIYINGVLTKSGTGAPATLGTTSTANYISTNNGTAQPWLGSIDEMRVSNTARSAEDIRQTYEVGLRSHSITIDFGAKLNSGNLITGSGDLSFTVDATYYGLNQMGDQLFEGDAIIVRENYDGTEYLAQGTVTAVTASTGAVTVAAWDTGSTFPASGYTANADVFKWQREYWNITGPLDSHLNAATAIALRITDGNEGRTMWLDDFRSSGDYLTTSAGSTITSSTNNRYFQYRMIAHSWDENVSSSLTSATLDYHTSIAPLAPTSLLTEGLTNPTEVSTITPKFSAIHSDPDSDNAGYYEIEVNNKSDFTGDVLWDSGQTAITPFASGARSSDITYAGTALALNGYTYYWRIRFTDIYTDTGPWSDTATFVMTNVPIIPSLDSPANGSTNQSLTPQLKTTTHDNDGDYLRYKIQLCTDLAMTTSCQTFDQTVSQTGWSGQNTQTNTAYTSGTQATYTVQSPLLPATPYYWRSYAIDPAGTNTWNATQATPFSFTTGSSSPTFQMEGINMEGINVN